MSEPPDLRASDSDRGRIVERLREHSIEGRLTLEEFTERMAATYLARTSGELEELTRDLPSPRASVTSRRRPTRFLFSIFGSTERKGRIRMPAGELPELLEQASDEELRELSEAPEAHWEAINTFLDRNVEAEPGPSQDVALALDSFAQAAMEAKLELDTRADR